MPRPIRFEIQAANVEKAIAFYRELPGWEFNQWGKEPYRRAMQMDANAK